MPIPMPIPAAESPCRVSGSPLVGPPEEDGGCAWEWPCEPPPPPPPPRAAAPWRKAASSAWTRDESFTVGAGGGAAGEGAAAEAEEGRGGGPAEDRGVELVGVVMPAAADTDAD